MSASGSLPDRDPRATRDVVSDEHELVARVRAGDRDAFRQLFLSYYDRLVAAMRVHIRSQAVAEEEVQDIFFRLWERRSEWDVRNGLASYLYGAVRNRGINWQKHQHVADNWTVRATTELAVSGMGQGFVSPDAHAIASDFDRLLAQAVARLPERRRTAVLLRVQHRLTNAEVAAVMGISVKAVEKTLAAALRVLRDDLRGLL